VSFTYSDLTAQNYTSNAYSATKSGAIKRRFLI
jgi:hypothetical protein